MQGLGIILKKNNHGDNNVFLSFVVRNKYAKGLLLLEQDKEQLFS